MRLVRNVDVNVGVNDLKAELGLSVNPNPSPAFVTILTSNKLKSVEIIDVANKSIVTKNVSDNSIKLETNQLSNGKYVIKANTEKWKYFNLKTYS